MFISERKKKTIKTAERDRKKCLCDRNKESKRKKRQEGKLHRKVLTVKARKI